MSLAVAVQMDPIESINFAGNSTFALMLAAAARGHRLFYYTPDKLSWVQSGIVAEAAPIKVSETAGDYFRLGKSDMLDLASMDVVLLRQDPPFDLAYITSTYLLERLRFERPCRQ